MEDKLIEVWRKEFESLHNNLASYKESEKDAMWRGFLMAKRSQPSVVLPEIQICRDSKDEAIRHLDFEDMVYNLTAAGIPYTIKGE